MKRSGSHWTLRIAGAAALMVGASGRALGGAGDELFGGYGPGDELLTPAADRYTVRFEPAVFFAAPAGKLRLPGSPSGTIKTNLADLSLDNPRVAPYGELHIRSGDWRFSLSAFAVSLTDVATTALRPSQLGPVPVSTGDLVVSSMDFATGEAVLARQLGAPDRISGKADPDFAASFEAFGGVRFYQVAFDFRAPAGTTSADEFFIQPIGGVKTTLNIVNRFDFDLQASLGGAYAGHGRSSFSLEILNGFTYRPVENVGVQIGYRLYFYDLRSGQGTSRFEYTGAVAGLFVGVVIRF